MPWREGDGGIKRLRLYLETAVLSENSDNTVFSNGALLEIFIKIVQIRDLNGIRLRKSVNSHLGISPISAVTVIVSPPRITSNLRDVPGL